MPLMELADWLDEQTKPDVLWFAKRLSANDTLATKAHQAGPYLPKEILFQAYPSLNKPLEVNPRISLDVIIDSHLDRRPAVAIWYNNKSRNESRITNLGGIKSALLDPDSTGSIAVFAFATDPTASTHICHVWVCDHETEEDLVEERLGSIEPGEWRIWPPEQPGDLFSTERIRRSDCRLEPAELPISWRTRFPSAQDIINKTLEMRPDYEAKPDVRLLRRRACEYDIFRSVEEAIELPEIRANFTSIDAFLSRAQTILQRRKARAGLSLELHVRAIFIEERLQEKTDFAFQPKTEGDRNPDFIFPSLEAYKDPTFPDDALRMLAVKTTCKDRWRQICNEAARVKIKHLLTLQEGVSENQFREMNEEGVKLIVPEGLATKYPSSIRPHLQTLESFIGDVRLLRRP